MAEEIKKGIAAADASIEVGLFPISEVTSYHEENVNFVNDSAAVIVGPICLKGGEEEAAPLFQTYGTRFAKKALELFK